MKRFSSLVLVGLVVSNFAEASFDPRWERPIMAATLRATDGVGSSGVRALKLTMHRRDGSEAATSFTLLEHTGIVCVTAPCPTYRTTEFKVTGVHASFHNDSTRYEAIEVLKNIPPNVRANARMAPRKLLVTESSMELVAPGGGGFLHKTIWDVEVQSFSKRSQTYVGYPKALVTIQSVEND